MTETYTPECDYNTAAQNFELKGIDGKTHTLASCKGSKATLIIFMCNHCPYVKSILDQLIVEVSVMQKKGIGCVAINSNDYDAYPEDSYENMQDIDKRINDVGYNSAAESKIFISQDVRKYSKRIVNVLKPYQNKLGLPY